MRKLPVIILVVAFLFSCSDDSEKGYEMISVDLERPIDVSVFEIADSIRLVQLETTDECLIARMSKIIEYKGRFYILDTATQSLFVFDHTGKFIFKIASRGRGPQEYNHLANFALDDQNRQLLLLDPLGYLLFYDLDGNFIERTHLSPDLRAYHNVFPLNRDSILLLSPDNHPYQKALYSRSSKETIVQIATQTPASEAERKGPGPDYAYRNNLFEGITYGNEVITISEEGNPIAYSYDFQTLNNTPRVLERFKKHLEYMKENRIGFRDVSAVGPDRLNSLIYILGETSKYRICFVEAGGEYDYRTVFFDKSSGKTIVLKETTENIRFLFPHILPDKIIQHSGDIYNTFHTGELFYNESILNEADKEIARSHKPEEDNPLIIEFYLKK